MACLSNKSLPPNVIEYAKISKNNAIVWILGSPKTKGFMIGHISDLLNWITNSFKWPLCLNPDNADRVSQGVDRGNWWFVNIKSVCFTPF